MRNLKRLLTGFPDTNFLCLLFLLFEEKILFIRNAFNRAQLRLFRTVCRMKTLFVIDSMASGGAQRILINVVETFRQKNIEVTVFLYQPKEDFFLDRLQSMGARVIKLSRQRDGFSLLVVIELIRLYWQKFDCIFSFQPTANIYCILARVFSPTSGSSVVNLVLLLDQPKKRLIANLANFYLRKLFVTAYTEKVLIHHFQG